MAIPRLEDLLGWSGSGVMPGRTWVMAPDKPTLKQRWEALTRAKQADKPGLFPEHPTDRRVDTVLSDGLPGFPATKTPIGKETGPCPDPVRIGYRSFDRQWIIPDKRLINRPNPTLWSVRSEHAALPHCPTRHDTDIGACSNLHRRNSRPAPLQGGFGGRAFPLWRDPGWNRPNIVPGLLEHLAERYRQHGHRRGPVRLPRCCALPSWVHVGLRRRPGGTRIRIPLTADPQAIRPCCDDRQASAVATQLRPAFQRSDRNRPKKPPRLPHDRAPHVLGGHPIPGDSEHMPTYSAMTRNPRAERRHGRISNVTPRMREYDVAGLNVLNKWFGYRRRNRERPPMGDRRSSPLQQIPATAWRAEYTSELIDLLNVLGLLADLEPDQAELLAGIIDGPLIGVDELTASTSCRFRLKPAKHRRLM